MPDAVDSNRKRSRSPSDSEQQKHHKRANTGATPTSDDSHAPNTATSPSVPTPTQLDVTMTDPSNADTAASTPSHHLQPKDEPSDSGNGILADDANHEKQSNTDASPASSSSTPAPAAPSAQIHMRCLIVTQDASIIIGKGGSHVNEIREKSGARVMVSESIPGNPERILNVSGPLDAVSKVRPFQRLLRARLTATSCHGLVLIFLALYTVYRHSDSSCVG
jgi:heterogeneous nuclear rnp K-like protein